MDRIKLLLILCLLLPGTYLQASSLRVVELFRYGSVQMQVDHVQLGQKSGLFLKLNQNGESRCVHIRESGEYPFDSLSNAFSSPGESLSFFTCNLRALALRLKSPSRLLFSPAPRSGETENPQYEKKKFNQIWHSVIEKKENIAQEELLAAGIWFFQHQKPERSAHIFRFAYQQKQNPWLLELHQQAYSQTSPEAIENEIALTRMETKNRYSQKNALALLIGVQNYKEASGFKKLNTPLEDIGKLNDVLVNSYGYLPENVISLPNATYQQILDGLTAIKKQSNSNSNLLIYYGGHGVIDDQEYFWIPGDAEKSPRTWVYTDYVLNKIKNIDTLHTLLIVDSCFSGALNSKVTRGHTEQGIKKLYAQKSRQLITSGGVEPVIDGGGGKHSVFAKNLLQILETQPDHTPLSAESLFAKLQPRVVGSSNQTPTLDRMNNSDDKWGQFYFFKSGMAQANTEAEETKKIPEKQENKELFSISTPDAFSDFIGGIGFQTNRSTINVSGLLEKESLDSYGVEGTVNFLSGGDPIPLHIKYQDGKNTVDDEIEYQQQTHNISMLVRLTQFEVGIQTKNLKTESRISQRGFNYYWKRIRMEWDTSDVPNNKGDSEYANIGSHILNYQFYEGYPVTDQVSAGFLNNVGIGMVNITGNVQVARKDKYNTDVSNTIFSFRSGPEVRYQSLANHIDLKFGGSFEYIWQPMDDKGGSDSGDNTVNASHQTTQVYAFIGVSF